MTAQTTDTSRNAIQYLRANANIGVHYIDVATAIHAPKNNVNNALTRTVKAHPEVGIRRIGPGQYIFKPEYQTNGAKPEPEVKKEVPQMYEFVGQTQDGTIIVRDENSILYRLAERL